MKRRAYNVLALACLMLAVGIAMVWLRGLSTRDQVIFGVAGRKCAIAIFPHHVYVIAANAPAERVLSNLQMGLKQYPSRPRYWELQFQRRPGRSLRIGIPFWLPVTFAVVPPMWWLIQRVQVVRRRASGLCRTCGYDLRASRDRCPECGSPIPDDACRAPVVTSLT